MTRQEPSGTVEIAGREVSRRNLLRAGATVAWAVPVIQVVGAAPASAATTSSNQCVPVLSVEIREASFEYHNNGQRDLYMTINVCNLAPCATTGLALIVSFPDGDDPNVTPADPDLGWTDTKSGNNTDTHILYAPRQLTNTCEEITLHWHYHNGNTNITWEDGDTISLQLTATNAPSSAPAYASPTD